MSLDDGQGNAGKVVGYPIKTPGRDSASVLQDLHGLLIEQTLELERSRIIAVPDAP